MKRLLIFSLVVLTVFALAVPAFAAGTYPSTYNYNGVVLPFFSEFAEIGDDYPFLLLKASDNGYEMLALSQEPVANDYGIYFPYAGGKVIVYSYDSASDSWVFVNSSNKNAGAHLVTYSANHSRQWSNFDIYNSKGTLYYEGDLNFSQAPLAVTVLNLAGERLEVVVIPEMVQTMTILVLCGVGCLASLTVLKLLGKRSLIYRS